MASGVEQIGAWHICARQERQPLWRGKLGHSVSSQVWPASEGTCRWAKRSMHARLRSGRDSGWHSPRMLMRVDKNRNTPLPIFITHCTSRSRIFVLFLSTFGARVAVGDSCSPLGSLLSRLSQAVWRPPCSPQWERGERSGVSSCRRMESGTICIGSMIIVLSAIRQPGTRRLDFRCAVQCAERVGRRTLTGPWVIGKGLPIAF